jgi:cytoskeletal protein RodZ
MPEIGSTLREARMRSRIDISEIETETKIRAKYLRALENEEWDLLPGPTYVKSFLKTYAEALGLDARLLVEEYKLRHERLSDTDLSRPIGAAAAGRRRPEPRGLPPGAIIGGCVLALLVGLFVLGKLTGGDDGEPDRSGTRSTATVPASPGSAVPATTTRTTATKPPASKPKTVRLTLRATSAVYVCLRAAGNRTLVRGETLQPGDSRGPYKSSTFVMSLGNNGVVLRVNGKGVSVPASSGAIGLRITRKGRTRVPESQQPQCRA